MTLRTRAAARGALVPSQAIGTVRGRYRHALTVSWAGGGWGTVVERDGDDYPWGLRIAALPSDVAVGDKVVVDDGSYIVGHHDLTAAVYTPRPRPPMIPGTGPLGTIDGLAESVATLDPLDRTVFARFQQELNDTATAARFDSADHLVEFLAPVVGAGSGLTPFGDDLIVGALAGLLAIDPRSARPVAPLTRTSDLSGWFIEVAALGHIGRCLDTVASATVLGDQAARDEAIPRLLSFGATSGLGMALGVAGVVAAHPSTSTKLPTLTRRTLPW